MPIKERIASETPEQRERRLEYGRNYNKINSEKINEANVRYRQNSLKYQIFKKLKISCECGGKINAKNKFIHKRTNKHFKILRKSNYYGLNTLATIGLD